MESKAFRICPFCHSASPVADERCAGCHRSLAGLTLPVYGSEMDAVLAGPPSGTLVDLPLREPAAGAERTPAAPVAPATRAPVVSAHADRASVAGAVPASPDALTSPLRATPPLDGERHGGGRVATLAIGGALVASLLMGGWLVLGQDHPRPEAAASPAKAVRPPAATLPAATKPPSLEAAPVTTEPAPPATEAAAPAPPTRVARAASRTLPRPPIDDRDTPSFPPAEVYTVHPDVRSGPVDVQRSTDDLRYRRPAAEPLEPIEPPDAAAQAGLRDRLARAQQRRDIVFDRVRRLRARTNVPVIRNLADYERAQHDLSAALDDLERAEAEVSRLHRLIGGRD